MKISNTELLNLIWAYQVKLVAQNVLMHFVNGTAVDCRDNPMSTLKDPHIKFCSAITDKLKSNQLRKRIMALVESNDLSFDNPFNFSLSHVHNDLREEMAELARVEWIKQGVPRSDASLFTSPDVDKKAMCVIDDFESKKQCVEDVLMAKFGCLKTQLEK
jgi:hypothetical protein